jgi:hypothetical protein
MKVYIRRLLSLVLTLSLLFEPFGSRVFHHSSGHSFEKSSRHKKERNLRQISSRKSGILIEFRSNNKKTSKRIKQKNFIPTNTKKGRDKKLGRLLNKENIIRLAESIQKEAKKNKVRIKRVILGENVKHKLKDRRIAKELSSLLSVKSLKSRMRKLKSKIKKESRKKRRRRKLKKRKQKKSKQENDNSIRNLMGMPSSSSSSKGKGKDDEMGFNFMPGFSGMPFPPFMMNGPHFHPPLNVTVNALPHANRRTMDPPSVIQKDNLEEDESILSPILEKMHHLRDKIKNANNETNIKLNAKFQNVLNGFV